MILHYIFWTQYYECHFEGEKKDNGLDFKRNKNKISCSSIKDNKEQ